MEKDLGRKVNVSGIFNDHTNQRINDPLVSCMPQVIFENEVG